ncbi:hypothetical protein O181_005780 [Austropuccinia psidii MF-1]|uniref:Uncharacterized protein n=1 Tax=Austropuccinia psidii MF-1 TaxID=1389203 RepID=A0A9Q3BJM9_9BASI|nr:hypothetical protein [Austropuccinia psidii MF-1]
MTHVTLSFSLLIGLVLLYPVKLLLQKTDPRALIHQGSSCLPNTAISKESTSNDLLLELTLKVSNQPLLTPSISEHVETTKRHQESVLLAPFQFFDLSHQLKASPSSPRGHHDPLYRILPDEAGHSTLASRKLENHGALYKTTANTIFEDKETSIVRKRKEREPSSEEVDSAIEGYRKQPSKPAQERYSDLGVMEILATKEIITLKIQGQMADFLKDLEPFLTVEERRKPRMLKYIEIFINIALLNIRHIQETARPQLFEDDTGLQAGQMQAFHRMRDFWNLACGATNDLMIENSANAIPKSAQTELLYVRKKLAKWPESPQLYRAAAGWILTQMWLKVDVLPYRDGMDYWIGDKGKLYQRIKEEANSCMSKRRPNA